jgi:hypothetical protein
MRGARGRGWRAGRGGFPVARPSCAGARAARGAGVRRGGRRRDLGQTTTEWLMIAGLLTAVAVVLLGIIPPGLRFYAQSLITSVRTIAP